MNRPMREKVNKMTLRCVFALVFFMGLTSVAASQNMALELKSDPKSFFEAPNHDVFHKELGNQMTVEAWIFVTDMAGERMVVNKEDSWEFAAIDGFFQSALNGGGGWAWFNSAIQIKNKEWTHVAMTWDGKNVRMFVNGKEGAKSPTAGKSLNATDSTFKVGRRVRGNAVLHSIFDGLVDEVRISKTIRYNGNYKVPQEGFEPDNDTVALYHFDEQVGRKIRDFSKSRVNGNLMGKAKLVPSKAPTDLSVKVHGKVTVTWGKVKKFRL